jgi:hypothetical protein
MDPPANAPYQLSALSLLKVFLFIPANKRALSY